MGLRLKAVLVWGVALLSVWLLAYFLLTVFQKVTAARYPHWKIPPGVSLVPPPRAYDAGHRTFPNRPWGELKKDINTVGRTNEADKLLAALKATTEQLHLTFHGPARFEPQSGSISSIAWNDLELSSQESAFDFAYPSGDSIVFINSSLEQAPEQPDTEKAKAAWTVERAIEVATAYRADFFDVTKFHFASPTANYRADTTYKAGEWDVRWQRTDGKGHNFASNQVSLTLSERYGLKVAAIYLDDSYEEFPATPMTKEIAVSIAELSHPAMGTPSIDIHDYKVNSAELEIVEPYMVGEGDAHCRLAWVIQLQPIRYHPVNYMDAQIVVVDALTGQIIGNDAFM